MPRIDPSRQVSITERLFRLFHDQTCPQVEFSYEIWSKVKSIVQPQCSVINPEIGESGCRGSIRLVKSV